MKILILIGSPRPKGNTKRMIGAFCEGLEKAGHEWDVTDVCRLNIHGCLACEYCHGKGNGQCVQKDDMQNVYHLLQKADMLVIASPIYYHGLTGQLKCCIDRFYAMLYPNDLWTLVFPPITLKAKWFVLIFMAIELFTGITGTLDGIAHFAHLGGALFGFILIWSWKKTGKLWQR